MPKYTHVRKLPSGRWQARYVGPDGRSHAKTFDQAHEAAEWVTSEKERVRRRNWSDPRSGRATVGALARPFVRTLTLKPKTIASYESLLRTMILPTFGPVAVQDIRPSDVRVWMAVHLRDGLSASRVRQAFRLLSQVLSAAVADGRIASNPCAGIRAPRLPETHPSIVAPEQAINIAEHCRPPYDLLILVLSFGGLRVGEGLALRRSCVDLETCEIHVRESVGDVTEETGDIHEDGRPMTRTRTVIGPTKTHQQRTLRLPDFVMARLAKHLEIVPVNPDALLFTSRTGAPVRYGSFRRNIWAKAVAAVGLNVVTPHDLRASHASWLIDAGFSVVDVASRLGHSSAAVTTRYYARPLPGRDIEIAAAFDRRLAEHVETGMARSWHMARQRHDDEDLQVPALGT